MKTETAGALYEELLNVLKNKKMPLDRARLERVYEFAERAHAGQLRRSGDPYITHPLSVALTVARMGLDQTTVEAALLHDVVEDTDVPLTQIRHEFGDDVAMLVDGVTKLGQLDFEVKQERYVENLRKMFLAMAKDIRVVILKLADRLHNMETLDALPEEDRRRIAKETLDIFAPLADRLGMGELKAQLEDLAFRQINPKEFSRIEVDLSKVLKERDVYVEQVKAVIAEQLRSAGIRAEIEGRPKHIYSISKKLSKTGGDLSKIYDLLAIRIIVWRPEECYKALGIIHANFKPLIYRIKDYIAVPKPNGYQSLHTTVFGPDGVIMEIQIRTAGMHQEAERGVAAHFHYDEQKSTSGYAERAASFAPTKKLGWVTQLMDWQKEIAPGSQDFVEGLKIDVFRDRIFCFTPKGDVYDLPEGATPVDFAYAVHSDVGNTCVGALVGGKMVPLDTRLSNRDIVEILTQKSQTPRRDWLNFVKTASARNRIRAYFKTLDRTKNIEAGRAELDTELAKFGKSRSDKLTKQQIRGLLDTYSFAELDDVFAQVGEGQITPIQVLRRLFTREELGLIKVSAARSTAARGHSTPSSGITVAGEEGVATQIALCCKPLPGQPVVGVITRRHTITIHRADCSTVERIPAERVLPAEWSAGQTHLAQLLVDADDRVGLIRDVSSAVAELGLNLSGVRSNEQGGLVALNFSVEIEGIERLDGLMRRLQRIPGVKTVRQSR
jgi:GTP pyrophosphokinase